MERNRALCCRKSIENTLHCIDAAPSGTPLPILLNQGRSFFLQEAQISTPYEQRFWSNRWDLDMRVSLQIHRFIELLPLSHILLQSPHYPIPIPLHWIVIHYLSAAPTSPVNKTELLAILQRVSIVFNRSQKLISAL